MLELPANPIIYVCVVLVPQGEQDCPAEGQAGPFALPANPLLFVCIVLGPNQAAAGAPSASALAAAVSSG